MKYTLSIHATQSMVERAIEEARLERVLDSPALKLHDDVEPDVEHWFAIIKEKEGRVLHVIVNVGKTPPNVITAYFDRRMRGKI